MVAKTDSEEATMLSRAMAESMTPQSAARTALQLQQEADDAALARQLQNGSALDGDKDKEELIDLESDDDDAPGSPMSVGRSSGADAGGSSDAVPPPAPVVPAVADTAAGCIIVLKRGQTSFLQSKCVSIEALEIGQGHAHAGGCCTCWSWRGYRGSGCGCAC